MEPGVVGLLLLNKLQSMAYLLLACQPSHQRMAYYSIQIKHNEPENFNERKYLKTILTFLHSKFRDRLKIPQALLYRSCIFVSFYKIVLAMLRLYKLVMVSGSWCIDPKAAIL